MRTATILVVEASPELRELFTDVLTDAGYQVYAAGPLEVTTGTIAAARPDLLMLEIAHGSATKTVSLIEQLRQQEEMATLPILVSTTSHLLLDGLDGALRQLSCMTLCKPFTLDSFLALIQAQLTPLRSP